jgi:hypothetical protein
MSAWLCVRYPLLYNLHNHSIVASIDVRLTMLSANVPAGEHCCRQARREEPLTFNVTM